MNCHIFGGVSSPSCSNYALKKTAANKEPILKNEVANTLKRAFM